LSSQEAQVPLNRDYIGRTFPAERPYEVSREKVRDFAEAIGDDNPVYRDAEAAKAAGHPDVIAPPTFAIAVTLKTGSAAALSGQGDLGLNFALVVHGEQKFTHHRPIRVGDTLVGASTVSDIRDAGRNELMTIATELRTEAGELVCTAENTLVSRGTATSAQKG
jgi:acyl dehydratase